MTGTVAGAAGSPFDDETIGEVLAVAADHLGASVSRWSNTTAEPTATGMLFGCIVDLAFRDAEPRTETIFVETDPEAEETEGVLALQDPGSGRRVAAWVYPHDPKLPALATTVFHDSASVLLERLGIGAVAPALSVLAYRPGKRAVVRVDDGDSTVFLKVVRPKLAEDIATRHRDFTAAGLPVPALLGWSDAGLLALAPLPGIEAARVLTSLPADMPDRVLDLLERVAGVTTSVWSRPSLLTRASWYLQRVARLAPSRAGDLAVIADFVAAAPESRTVARRTIHGDLHLGQLFVDPEAPGRILGLLDIDTAGIGDRSDDLASFSASVLASALGFATGSPERDAALSLEAEWRARWPHDDAHRTAAIAAVHLLGHTLRVPLNPDPALLAHRDALIDAALRLSTDRVPKNSLMKFLDSS